MINLSRLSTGRAWLLTTLLLVVGTSALVSFFAAPSSSSEIIPLSAAASHGEGQPYVPSGGTHQQAQEGLLQAFQCAQQHHALSPAILDSALSDEAASHWVRLRDDPHFSLEQLPATYSLRSVIALDLARPSVGCSFGGFDVLQLPPLTGVSRIGVAIFPAQMPDGSDGASAVVLGRSL